MDSKFGLNYVPVTLKNLDLAYKIQKEQWPYDPDYQDLYDKAINTTDDNIEFLVYENDILIGITGVDVYQKYKDSIWLDWFTILAQFRGRGLGKKVLLDTIDYCKTLKKYKNFRIDTTYYEDKIAIILYDKVMDLKEDYTVEDTDEKKYEYLIYTKGLNSKAKLWNNKYLGLQEYYNQCK